MVSGLKQTVTDYQRLFFSSLGGAAHFNDPASFQQRLARKHGPRGVMRGPGTSLVAVDDGRLLRECNGVGRVVAGRAGGLVLSQLVQYFSTCADLGGTGNDSG
jgi:hypothetical protein